MLDIQPICAFDDNYIWLLIDEQTSRAFVVDPGDAQPVIDTLQAQRLQLAGILITHHHFDHVGGLQALCERYEPIVYGPKNPAIDGITHRLARGDQADVMGTEFQVLEVPGHTLDHIAFYHEGEPPLLFCGDTLFAGGCGRIFEGDPPMMLQSLERIAALPPATRVYCAHEYTLSNLQFARAVEPDNTDLERRFKAAQDTRELGLPTVPSELGLELATNPFLRCEALALRTSLEEQGKLDGNSTVEVFTTVRGWKDHF